MNQNSCFIYISKLSNSKRKTIDETCIVKRDNELHITYCENDSLEKFEADINLLAGSSSFFYFFKKILITSIISFISVFVILIGFLSVSIYEDFLKKVVFETPFDWSVNDFISLIFVLAGDNLMKFASDNKYEGIIINGYVRDTVTTKEFDVGLIAKGTCPRKYIPVQDGLINVPIVIDDVEINSGDFVYVDPDGIVICREKLV